MLKVANAQSGFSVLGSPSKIRKQDRKEMSNLAPTRC